MQINIPSGKTDTQLDSNKDDQAIEQLKNEDFKYLSLAHDLDTVTIEQDQELMEARQQYCECSGKPLCKVKIETVQALIDIHGREITLKILRTQQKKVSLEWIWLNTDGLENLAAHDPKGYFVYCASKLLQDLTVHSELMRLHEAANAWQNLSTISNDVIAPINELLRRLLGQYKRKQLNGELSKLKTKRVNEITQSIDSLTTFQFFLTDLIQKLIASKKKKEIYEAGMMQFRTQTMITALSELELSVGKEFNDFDIVDGKSIDSIHAVVGTKYRHSKQDKNKFSQKTIKKPAGKITLKIGGSQ